MSQSTCTRGYVDSGRAASRLAGRSAILLEVGRVFWFTLRLVEV